MSEDKVPYTVSPAFVGLDLSMTGTGFCLRRLAFIQFETIKTVPGKFPDKLARLIHIRDTVMGKIPQDARMVCVEDFFTPANRAQIGAAISLAMLGAMVRVAMYERGIPFVIIAPSQLKKFVTGKGKGEKSMILREVYKRWGIDAGDDNQADSIVLSYLAEALVVGEQDNTPKFQSEVIKTIRRERPRYNVKEPWALVGDAAPVDEE